MANINKIKENLKMYIQNQLDKGETVAPEVLNCFNDTPLVDPDNTIDATILLTYVSDLEKHHKHV